MSEQGNIVWVVAAATYGEQEGVVAVYSTEFAAREFADQYNKRAGYQNYRVQRWALDDPDWNPHAAH